MGRFVVTVNPTTGLKDIQQVPIEEEVAPKDPAVDFKKELDAALDAELRQELEAEIAKGTPPELTVENGGDQSDADPPADEAATEIMAGLYEQNVGWAKERIAKIRTQEGIVAVRLMEHRHPEFSDRDPPGRRGVIGALQERSGEIAEGLTESDGLARTPKGPGEIEEPPAGDRGTGLPCAECEFTAGSEGGLAAHMESSHPEVAL